MRRYTPVAAIVLAIALLAPAAGFGHAERETLSPARPGKVPDQNRAHPVVIDVCKTGECEFEHIQSAVNDIPADNTTPTLIRIWPGLYKEEPSRVVPNGIPDMPNGRFSFEYHAKNPNAENLIGIIGKKNVTLRGMGATPRGVVIDVEFKKHVGIRGDRADGLIVENLSVYHAFDHGVYVLDQDGYVFDRIVSGYSREYGFLMFATDHGLTKNCEAFGAGDAGIYPGGAANTPGRFGNEVANCKAYHNVIGYSGTQGNYNWVHDNEFYDNGIGLTSDSESDHPNWPQEHLLMERNTFHDNNFNVYSKDSDVESVVFEGFAAVPIGLGMIILSGNDNVIRNNNFWGHDRYAAWLSSAAGMIAPTGDPPEEPFLSERNQFVANKMYNPAKPEGSQNAADFAWDGMGLTNCWQDNVRSPDGTAATSDGVMLPPCKNPVDGSTLAISPGVPNPLDFLEIVSMLTVEDTDGDGDMDRPGCDILGTCGFDWDGGPDDPKKARNLPEGYKPPPPPSNTCGPSTCPASSSAKVLGTKTSRTFSGKASALPATGVGSPLDLGIALLVGAGGVAFSLIRRRFPR